MSSKAKVEKKNIQDILSLTPMQEGMLFHYLKSPESDFYVEQLTLELTGELDLGLLERAWNHVCGTNEMLRTVFRWEKLKAPAQMILKEHTVDFHFIDLSHSADSGAAVDRIREQDRQEAYDLQDVPFRVTVCKTGENTHFMIIGSHHILYDGWSNGIILRELFEAYHAYQSGTTPVKKTKTAFKEFVRRVSGGDSGAGDETFHFWETYLADNNGRTELPVKGAVSGKMGLDTPGSGSIVRRLEPADRAQLEAFAAEGKVTPAAVFYTAWGLLLQRYTDSNDVFFGTTVAGRSAKIKGIEEMVGLFINTLPLRVKCEPGNTAQDVLTSVNDHLPKREPYENTSLVKILEHGGNGSNEELYDSIVVVENYPLDARTFREDSSLKAAFVSMRETTHYDLTLVIRLTEGIDIKLMYREEMFETWVVEAMADHFLRLFNQLLCQPSVPVLEIDMLSEEERQGLLVDFNGPVVDYERDRTIYALLEDQAARTPEATALIAAGKGRGDTVRVDESRANDGDVVDEIVTYRELNGQSNSLARYLRKKGVKPGRAVGVMLERSRSMVVAIHAILKAGGAYLPIDPEYPEKRIAWIMENSGADLLITTSDIFNAREDKSDSALQGNRECILVDDPNGPWLEESPENLEHVSGPDDMIYIIFTSGSTGKPKGAGVRHRGFMNLMHWFVTEFKLGSEDNNLLLTSLSFDLTQKNFYASLMKGGIICIPSVNYFDPLVLLKEIHRRKITWINCTPSMFYKLVECEESEGKQQLASLRYIFLGGEPISFKTLIHWLEADYHQGVIVNTYGPTECTDICNWYVVEEPRRFLEEVIPVGYPVYNVQLVVSGSNRQLLPVGVPGELLISGDGVGLGYVNDDALTAEKFTPCRFNGEEPEKLFYKTGDLVKWRPDGTVEFIGRMDHQVKVRGFRIELGEIESQLLAQENIREAVVMAREGADGDKYLCAYMTVHDSAIYEETEVRQSLAAELPDYMVPAHLIMLDKMPLNPNGKVDRKALPEPDAAAGREYIAPRNEQETRMTEIWAGVLGISAESISIDDNFFQLGGHSLRATSLVNLVYKVFDKKIRIPDLFSKPTVRELVEHLENMDIMGHTAIQAVSSNSNVRSYPLTPSQERFHVLQLMFPGNKGYNMNETMVLEGNLDIPRLENAFKQLIERHDSLRTSFHLEAGESVQVIHGMEEIEFHLDIFDLSHVTEGVEAKVDEVIDGFIRPFDLTVAPLLRVGLIKLTAMKHLMLVSMHHIISDGTSTGILVGDFTALYAGETLPPLPLQYKDYVKWFYEDLEKRGTKESSGDKSNDKSNDESDAFKIEPLNLPTDYPRAAHPVFSGGTVRFEMGVDQTEALARFVHTEGVTLYMVLLAAFGVLMGKLCGQDNLVVGSPLAGRSHADLDGIIGLFINTMILNCSPAPEKPFQGFLAEVKQKAVDAFAGKGASFEELLDKVGSTGVEGRNPLFDVMFVLQNMEMPEVEMSGIHVIRDIRDDNPSKFDLTLYCEEKDNRLYYKFEYASALFKRETVERYCEYYQNIVTAVLTDPGQRISDIQMMSDEERRRLLVDFNGPKVDYPREKTIYAILEEQVARTPDRPALIDAGRGEGKDVVTYRELNGMANRLARYLRKKGVKAGTVVGIMLERSGLQAAAIQAVLKAGGAYLPIDPEYPDNRIAWMMENSGAEFLLITADIYRHKSATALPGDREFILIDDPEGAWLDESGENLPHISGPDDMIYIIFTSGSTGKPKGAGVYHRGFMNLMHWFVKEFELEDADTNLLVTSMSFDLTQKNFYASLMKGGTICIPPVNHFDPRVFLEEIQEHRVTWINCTPSMFYKMVEYEESEGNQRLASLRYVFLGGEPISFSTLINWLESDYHDARIVNTYGPTECTDICNWYVVEEPRRFLEEVIPVGYPVYNVQLVVAGPQCQLLPMGVAGELLIAGDGVGLGYINDKELTEKKFVRLSFTEGEPEKLFYKTGDLVKWREEGTVEFIGRIDHQVKVRGFRIELGEIESQLLAIDNIKETVVMARDGKGGDKYLCAYMTAHDISLFKEEEIRAALAAELPDYMVPAYLILLEKMPLNPNGKVDRKALPLPDPTMRKDYEPPSNEMEEELAKIWSEILDLDKSRIGVNENFFKLGGHSLKAAGLVGLIHKRLSAEMPIARVFEAPTIKSMAYYVDGLKKESFATIEPVEKQEYYSLSPAQRRLFILYGMDEHSTVYNISAAFMLEGDLDIRQLEAAFLQLIRRHESLRTSFRMVGDEPVQVVHNHVSFGVEFSDVPADGPVNRDEILDGFIRPFDLSVAPLLRVGLFREAKDRYFMVADMHHIISDGVSSEILAREFSQLMSGRQLSPLKIQYKDYSGWLLDPDRQRKMEIHERYWLSQFAGELSVMELPLDFPAPSVHSYEGDSLDFSFAPELTAQLKVLAGKRDITSYMVLVGIFSLLMSKLSGLEDLVIGTAAAGREHSDLEQVMGMFVNTMGLRCAPEGDLTVSDYLSEMKDVTLEAFENQDYPFEQLIEKLVIPRDPARNPLFDVMLVLQNMGQAELKLPGLTLSRYPIPGKVSRFRITLQVFEEGDTFRFALEYSNRLFKRETIERFVGYFRRIARLVSAPDGLDTLLKDVDILSQEERRNVLETFNDTARPYPADKTVDQLFEETALARPLEIAVAFEDQRVTYGELLQKVRALAGCLQQYQPGESPVIAVQSEASVEMVAAVLAILEIGGAYMPIDPLYPANRRNFMLADSATSILLAGAGIEPADLGGRHNIRHNITVIDISDPVLFQGLESGSEDQKEKNVAPVIKKTHNAESLAYIMYTSGSTGIPKGVMVKHRNVVRLVKNSDFARLEGNECILQTGALSFDASTFEIWGALLNGGTLCLAQKEKILDPVSLKGIIREFNVNTMWMTAPLFNRMIEADIDAQLDLFRGVTQLLVGGDVLSPPHINKALDRYPGMKIINGYGPTENTTFSATFEITRHYEDNIPIGKPITNSTAYILDKYHNPVPINVPGELYLGGDGLARGYLNNPELTARSFINLDNLDNLDNLNNLKNSNDSNDSNDSGSGNSKRAGIYYRTGDWASWWADGTIRFLGRIDQQVKIRGFRIEPGEIETRLTNHRLVKEAVVVTVTDAAGEKQLCAYLVPESGGESREQADLVDLLKEHLSESLPDYMVPVYFTLLDTIPLTANGKVDRKALPEPDITSGNEYVAPVGATETALVDIWSDVLAIPEDTAGVTDNFFQLGGHSLNAVSVINKIHQRFDVKISIGQIFQTPTIKELSQIIDRSLPHLVNLSSDSAAASRFTQVQAVDNKDFFPLSPAQKRMYILGSMDEISTTYNIYLIYHVKGSLDINRLNSVFREVIARHESLRTSFHMLEGEPVQKIHDDVSFSVDYWQAVDHLGEDVERKAVNFIRPFNLSEAPLLRVGLFRKMDGSSLMVVDLHHIICDGVSHDILVREFYTLYSGNTLPPITVQYKDYVEWLRKPEQQKKLKEQEQYWLHQFEGELPVLELPLDFQAPAVHSFDGDTFTFTFDPELAAGLKHLARQTGATLYMVLAAMFSILMSKLSGADDLVIGAVSAGRNHVDLKQVIGMFVNTLALRYRPAGEKTVTAYLDEVKTATLESFENQDYPFDDLVEKLEIARDSSRNPLFDVMLVLQNMELAQLELPEFTFSLFEIPGKMSRFRLTLVASENEEGIVFSLEYATRLFKRETVQRFMSYYKRIADTLTDSASLTSCLKDIDILSPDERRQIVEGFNDTTRPYPEERSIDELFRETVAAVPFKPAVIYRDSLLTYGDLYRRARALANHLLQLTTGHSQVIGVMADASLEIIVAVTAVLETGCIYMPIDPGYPEERRNYMLADSSASIILTGSGVEPGSVKNSETVTFIDINDPKSFEYKSSPESPGETNPGGHRLAYIIYTSGSTGRPKGVMVEHRNVVRLVKNTNFAPLDGRERILQTGALSFDASTFEIWGTLLNGGLLCLAKKEDLLEPSALRDVIVKNGINTMFLTTPLFNRMVDADIDLNLGLFKGMELLLVGGDTMSPSHVNRARDRYPDLNISNVYGPTENTTFSTAFPISCDFDDNIPIGGPIVNSTCFIVDRHEKHVPIGVSGELYVGGDGVARGYMNRPELTAERFILNKNIGIDKPGVLYRTGDRVAWRDDGAVIFQGRIDQQVKIRGFRIEPGEIETRLTDNPLVKDAAVIPVVDGTGDKQLCAYVVPVEEMGEDSSKNMVTQLKMFLSQSLPEYMIPVYFRILDHIPLNVHGKVDRTVLPAPDAGTEQEYIPPETPTEKCLVDIWSDVLAVPADRIGIADDFFQLGGHSLRATTMIARIHQALQVKIPLSRVFQSPTIRDIAAHIRTIAPEGFRSITPVETRDHYLVSSAQRRLYVVQQLDKQSCGYNMPNVVELEGELDKDKLQRVFETLIQRHESFRTSFHVLDEEPVQMIHSEVPFSIRFLQAPDVISPQSISDVLRRFLQPFDLSQAPLLRLALLTVDSLKHIMIVDMHHIISDGLSMGIFMREFMALYNDRSLPALPLQYKDFAQWQADEFATGILELQADFWRECFAGEIPVLELPTDSVRPAMQSFDGADLTFTISSAETTALKAQVLEQGVTVYMMLLALYNLLMSKLSGSEDIVVGSPAAGRKHADLGGIVGMFVNTLAMRNKPAGEKYFHDFLQEVKNTTLKAFENQDYPFEELVEQVAVNRDTGRNPLFDTMLALENLDLPEIRIPGLTLREFPVDFGMAKFDLTFYAVEVEDKVECRFEYAAKLFKEETMQRFIRYFQNIISAVVTNPVRRIFQIEMMPPEEKRRILFDFNNTDVPYPREKTIYGILEEQAARTPDRTALMDTSGGGEDDAVTYRQLNGTANQLARYLRKKGVKPGGVVGIMLERSQLMVAGILGILKAGGAYLPIDPEYPDSRITWIMESSGADLLLTTSEIYEEKSSIEKSSFALSGDREFILMDASDAEWRSESTENLPHISGPDDMIYIIFTSGSTGKPKGAGVRHRGFMNLMNWFVTEFELGIEDNNLVLTSLSFDLTQKNFYAPLMKGATVCIPPMNYFEPRALLDVIQRHRVTWINCTPSMFYRLVECEESDGKQQLASLRCAFLGGEPISLTTLIDWLEADYHQAKIINTYGPTECTDISNWYVVDDPRRFLEEVIPVGHPVYNVQLVVAGRNLQLQPVGVAGELLIAGDSVGLGYINDKDLTAQKFIHHSFMDGEPEKRYYKTGDLVKWRKDATVEFIGRIDHQVKVRGFRIELGEIESQLLAMDNIKEAVVMARDAGSGDKYLCAYITAHSMDAFREDDVREELAAQLPDYMVPAFFILLEKMPLNPNGKVDRKALPEPDLSENKNYVPPTNDIQRMVVDIWAETLEVDKKLIGINHNFFQLGGHSLKVVGVANKIHKAFGVEISIQDLFKHPTVAGTAQLIETGSSSAFIRLEKQPDQDYYPLSFSQKRLWLLTQLDPDSPTFNFPSTVTLHEAVDPSVICNVLQALSDRHEAFRTYFKTVAGEPVQVILPQLEPDLKIIDLSHMDDRERQVERERLVAEESIIPFRVDVPPLFRAKFIICSPSESDLVLTMNHLVTDGWSMEVLQREFSQLFNGYKTGDSVQLEPLNFRYIDYVYWHNKLLADTERMQAAKDFLEDLLSGDLPKLDLPYDFSPGKKESKKSAGYRTVVPAAVTERLKAIANERNASMFMVLLAAFNIMLSRISGQQDILLGVPGAARSHEDLRSIIGLFVNTLVLRNHPDPNKTFNEFLEQVRENTFQVLEYQDYPLELICKEYKIKYPDLSVFFNMSIFGNTMEEGLEDLDSYHIESVQDAKFDMVCYLGEFKNGIEINTHYYKERFAPETIEKTLRLFLTILENISNNPEKPLKESYRSRKKRKLKFGE